MTENLTAAYAAPGQTVIYTKGMLSAKFGNGAWPLGWLDNGHLLINNYVTPNPMSLPE